MNPNDPKVAAARAFVRSLNILLKYARLYGFGHPRTVDHFEMAWNELHAAIPRTNESGLVLGASGSQLLLDGAAIDVTPAERSFAQLLSAAGIGSIQFAANVLKDDLEQLVRAFPTQKTKPSALAERLKSALAERTGIRINEIRFVVEDGTMGESRATQLTARTLGDDTGSIKDWLSDPQKLLQLIAAAEGARGGPGGPGTGSGSGERSGGNGTGIGTGPGGVETGFGQGDGSGGSGVASGTGGASSSGAFGVGTLTVPGAGGAASAGVSDIEGGSGAYSGAPAEVISDSAAFTSPDAGQFGTTPWTGAANDTGHGGTGAAGRTAWGWSAKDEDILGILKLLTHLGSAATGDGRGIQPGPLHEQLTKLPQQSQEMLRQALVAIAAHAPVTNRNDPILVRLAEHLAIRFALERYQSGEVKVDAVRQMIDRMSREIEGLRNILGAHEEKMAESGMFVESHADLLDRQFWAGVPEKGKLAVLTSSEAWCIPARNVKQYVEQLLNRGDQSQAHEILVNYASCLQSPEIDARRRTAIGLAELADLYASAKDGVLESAIQLAGAQLGLERDDNLQGLISAAFVRLAQEAGTHRLFPAMLQALDSLDSVEHQRPVFAQSLRPRIGFDKRVPELIEEALRMDRLPAELSGLLQRAPRVTAENMVLRFNRTSNPIELQRMVDLAQEVGNDVTTSLRETLRTGSASEASETIGLLSRLDSPSIARWLPDRLRDWPRNAQDRMIRLMALAGAAERGWLLVSLLDILDPLLLPLAIDEIGFSEDLTCMQPLIRVAEGDVSRPVGGLARLKAVEALGRLKAQPSVELLRNIAEARNMLRWTHPSELRLAAVQSMAKIDPQWTREFLPHSGFSASDLFQTPLDPRPHAKFVRQRRYDRVRLLQPIPATAVVGQELYRLEVRVLSLGGGIAVGEKHLQPGTLATLKFGSSLRPIRMQVLMRGARTQDLGFEFTDMDLDERARLRKILQENRSTSIPVEQEAFVPTST